MNVKKIRVITLDSYLDNENHWHIEPGILAEVYGKSKKPVKDSKIILFDFKNWPDMVYTTSKQYKKFAQKYFSDIL